LFVTHDQVEALTMADRIGVLNEGRLVQIGDPNDIYDRPASIFVAQLVGSPRINLVSAARENGKVHIENSSLTLPVTKEGEDLPGTFTLGVRPEDIRPAPEGEFEGMATLVEPLGVETVVHLQVGEQTILSLVPGATNININEDVRFDIVQERLHYFDSDGNRI
jgi:ABC-type sugar transport system ATPase subunit